MKIEIEFASPRGRAVLFPPIDRALRGKIDFVDMTRYTKHAQHLMNEWGDSLPGMRIALDTTTAEATLIEPLHESSYGRIRDLIAKRGERLVDAREVFPKVDVATWLYWMARHRDSGLCRITSGTLGAIDQIKAEHGAPKLRTFAPVERDQVVDRLVAVMFALLTDKQREQATKMLAGVA